MLEIHSVHNPRIRQAVRLRDRRGRQRQGRIVIDGLREIRRALSGKVHAVEAFLCRELLADDAYRDLVRRLQEVHAEPVHVTRQVFHRLAFGDRSDGAVLIATLPSLDLDRLIPAPNALVVVLEGLEKPGNLGAIARTADAAGVSAIVTADARTDVYNPNAIRASLGAIFHLPIAAGSAPQVLAWLRAHEIPVYAARVDGTTDYASVDYRIRSAILLGNEAHGLSKTWQGADITAIALPMRGVVDSLNVSATAAVLFYEALRQRQCRDRT